jgi:hypothetical protein
MAREASGVRKGVADGRGRKRKRGDEPRGKLPKEKSRGEPRMAESRMAERGMAESRMAGTVEKLMKREASRRRSEQ